MTPMTEPLPPLPDETLIDDLAALPAASQLRLGAFRLFSRLLHEAPSVAFLAELRESNLLGTLATLATESASPASAGLRSLADWFVAADDQGLEEGRRDYLQLFVAKHLEAPPWESVYSSTERLVNQDAAREVLRAYAEAELGFDGWKQIPADHISLELAFAATLIAETPRKVQAQARLARFEAAHLASWVPRFCSDLGGAAKSPLYKHLAEALPALLTARAGA